MMTDSSNKKSETPMKTEIPWNELIYRARRGDAAALHRLFTLMQPYIESLCRVSYFASRLGSDEVRSILALRLAEFINSDAAIPEQDREVPYLLKRILRFHLINMTNKAILHSKYEMSESTIILPSGEDVDPHETLLEHVAADPRWNPESVCVQADFNDELALLIRQLSKKEQAVIQKLFIQQKTPAEAAKELRYTLRGLRNLRQKALAHLREIMAQRFQNHGPNQILEELQWTK